MRQRSAILTSFYARHSQILSRSSNKLFGSDLKLHVDEEQRRPSTRSPQAANQLRHSSIAEDGEKIMELQGDSILISPQASGQLRHTSIAEDREKIMEQQAEPFIIVSPAL